MLEETLKRGFEAMRLPCDGQALERFRIYYDLLEEKNRVMNLTAISGEDESATKHFLDSAAPALRFSLSGARVIDVGSGAGFPGLPMKIACPSLRLTLLPPPSSAFRISLPLCNILLLYITFKRHVNRFFLLKNDRKYFFFLIKDCF